MSRIRGNKETLELHSLNIDCIAVMLVRVLNKIENSVY